MSSPTESPQPYSGGPTEIGRGSTGGERMFENSSPQELKFEDRRVQVNDCSSGQDDSETELVPKRPSYPLNSKRVKELHLQQIAAALGLPTRGTAAITRQLIDGKLLEMDRDPRIRRSSLKAQVRIQSFS